MPSFTTYDPMKHKQVKVGNLSGTTLTKTVSRRHFMRVVDGYGIQADAMRELQVRGVKRIVIKEKETGVKREAKLNEWISFGREMDFGHGKQVFLSLKYMHLKESKPSALAGKDVPTVSPEIPNTPLRLF